jgi:hypothetical protein
MYSGGRAVRYPGPILLVCLLCALFILSVQHVVADEFEDTWKDPIDDVKDLSTEEPMTRPSLDIAYVSLSDGGDDILVQMVLDGPFDVNATYIVTIFVDGPNEIYLWGGGAFTASTPMGPINITGSASPDRLRLNWVVPKAEAKASSNASIYGATAYNPEGIQSPADDLQNAEQVGSMGTVDDEMDAWITYEFTAKARVIKTVQFEWVGEEARSIRQALDLDHDGDVTQSEVNSHKATFQASDTKWNRTSLTYMGVNAESTEMYMNYAYATGPSYSTDRIVQEFTVFIFFPTQKDVEIHTYQWNDELSRDPDLLPWKGSDDSIFSIEASSHPEEDKFSIVVKDMSEGMKKYISNDNTDYWMEGAELRADWNATMGSSQEISFKETERPDSGDECCPSLFIPLTVLPAMMMVGTTRWRRR